MKKVTVRQVGAAAGVSHATVSRVLNNDPRVHSRTRLRVLEAMRELDYRPEFSSARQTIALILPHSSSGGYMNHIMMSLRQEIGKIGYHTELVSPSDIGILNERIISGAISLSLNEDFFGKWKQIGNLPLVQVNRSGHPLDGVYSVRSDGEQAMELAVSYLHGRGHRRIAYLADADKERDEALSSRRHSGFICAMMRIGCEEPEEWMFYRSGYQMPDFRALCTAGVTSVICVGEVTGIRAARGIWQQGLRIPDDLSLVGMEYHTVSASLIPAQTTLAQNFTELSRRALAILQRLINRETVAEGEVVPYQLIERESVRSILSEAGK